MLIGEVLGSVGCTVINDGIKGLALKVVRLYDRGRPDRVVVASDDNVSPGNGDFVVLAPGGIVDYTITDFLGEDNLPYINTKINMKIS